MKTPENTEEDPDDPEAADEAVWLEYWLVVSSNKKLPVRT